MLATRKLILFTSTLAATASVAYAQQIGGWGYPLSTVKISCIYFDPNYPYSQDRQHLGMDLPSYAGTRVNSPVAGRIVKNETYKPADQAFLVIRETATGYEHVLGHIVSSDAVGRTVKRGDRVGSILDQGGNSHVHWGINQSSVAAAMGVSNKKGWGAGNWGWGKAPRPAKQQEAANRGWLNVNTMIGPRSHSCSRT